MEVRYQVVEAIVEAFTTDDPSALPPGATPEERAAADAAIGALLARRPGSDPRKRITRTLFRAYRSGDDWDDLFDRLSPFELAELREFFPSMPSRAARLFAERYLFPGNRPVA
jgi:hypothetical protein